MTGAGRWAACSPAPTTTRSSGRPTLPLCVEAARRGEQVTLINHGADPVTITVRGTDLLAHTDVGEIVLRPDGFAFVRLSPPEESP
ncbi:hypothetical protein CS0771_44970 [Catellatospora sp. IY07-71]|nr:hypothetical protein CS0771_44970 [Catellatospora sp. IY07-71]